MKILQKYHVVSHAGDFLMFGYNWGHKPKILGVVEELPSSGERTAEGVDWVATVKEVERVQKLTSDPKYPLRLAAVDGSGATSQADVDQARRQLDELKRSIAEAQGQQAELARDVASLTGQRDELRSDVAVLEEVVAEAEASVMKAEELAEAGDDRQE